MFTTRDFYLLSKYQVLNCRDTQKSAILINFSEQHPVKSFWRQDAAHHIGATGGKLLRVKTSRQCSLQADRQIRTRPQRGTFREKTQSERALRLFLSVPEMSPRKKFTSGTGHQAALQLDKTNSQQTTDIKAGLGMGRGKPQADITLKQWSSQEICRVNIRACTCWK